MAASDAPRTWTLAEGPNGHLWADGDRQPPIAKTDWPKRRVIELEPVLDLLERLTAENGPDIESVLGGEALLREHGRLEGT